MCLIKLSRYLYEKSLSAVGANDCLSLHVTAERVSHVLNWGGPRCSGCLLTSLVCSFPRPLPVGPFWLQLQRRLSSLLFPASSSSSFLKLPPQQTAAQSSTEQHTRHHRLTPQTPRGLGFLNKKRRLRPFL